MAGHAIASCHSQFTAVVKLKMQKDFFQSERNNLSAETKARSIAIQTLSKMKLSDHEIELVAEGFFNLKNIIQADRVVLEENIPIEETSISSILSFFSHSAMNINNF